MIEQWKDNEESKSSWAGVCYIMWKIWLSRNDKVFNGHVTRPDKVCQEAIRDATEFLIIQQERARGGESNSQQREVQEWQRPSYGKLKINIDGGLDKHGGRSGLGIIIRDWVGKFIAARAIGRQQAYDPLVVEAMAAREGLLLAKELGLNGIMLEGDSQQLVQLVRRRNEDHCRVGVIVSDIIYLMDGFSDAVISFVRRGSNRVVHEVAQKAVRGLAFSTWEFRPPLWLLSSLQGDSCPC